MEERRGRPRSTQRRGAPLLLLSGTLLPITAQLAPTWLYVMSRLNPVAYVMEATRAGFRGDLSVGSMRTGTVALVLMATVALVFGVLTFRNENRGTTG